jgi:hypothetical protein
MRAATVIKLLENKVEFLENLNRRLEALADWTLKFPKKSNEIAALYNDGVILGQLLKELEVGSGNSRRLREVNDAHNAFIIRYEQLWRRIQEEK